VTERQAGWAPIVAAIIDASRDLVKDRRFSLAFKHQRGHRATSAGRDDFAHWNGRVDELAR